MPSGVVSTGWPSVRDKCRELGILFRPWQDSTGRIILAKRSDGKYAATIGGTGMSIPRQVGKTFLVGAIIFALCLLIPNLTVIWTAHRLRTAEETFGKMQTFARRKKIYPHVAKIVLGSGEEEVRFKNGSRIMFGARERGFGRGFDEVDVLVYDEAQILTENALDDMVPATNQSRQAAGALLLFMGTPPKPTDAGEVFTRMRSEALSGEDEDTAWIEFGSDSTFEPTVAPAPMTEADWRQIGKANPSFPGDTPRESILRMRKQLAPEAMKREGYGIWDEEGGVLPRWGKLADVQSQALDPVAFALSVSKDRDWAAIAAAGRREDGKRHWVVIDYRRGTDWVAARVADLVEKWKPCAVGLDPSGPEGALINALEELEITTSCACHGEQGLQSLTARQVAQACGLLYDDAVSDNARHLDQGHLNLSIKRAQTKPTGEGGAWAFSRRLSTVDISPLIAVTLANQLHAEHGHTPDYDVLNSIG